jgi:hypothetical protein
MSLTIDILIVLCAALLVLFLGITVFQISFRTDECHSKWWPRYIGFIWTMNGISLLLSVITMIYLKKSDNEMKLLYLRQRRQQ